MGILPFAGPAALCLGEADRDSVTAAAGQVPWLELQPFRKAVSGGPVRADPWETWMERLLRRADQVGREGEVPVAAVVLDGGGRAVGWGSNRRHRHHDPLGHAELVALARAARLRSSWRFHDCTLIVTLEPCPMCAGALLQARMGRVVFGARDPKRGALGGTLDLSRHASAHHRMDVVGEVLESRARSQLEGWFRQRRQRAAESRRSG